MRLTFPTLALLPVLCVAQGGSPPAPPTPCAVPGVGSPGAPWRQVRASGFTFCVPGDWRPSGHAPDSLDAPQWNVAGGSLSWNIGQSPARSSDCTIEVRMQVVHEGRMGRNPTPAGPPQVRTSDGPRHQPATSITVDGVTLVIDQVECQGRWMTTALGTTPRVVITAVARTLQTAQQQLAAIHTIRFPIPSHNRALAALVDSFFAHPFRVQLQKELIDSANHRADVSVALGPSMLPWTCYADTGSIIRALDGVLTVAYIAGDVKGQLRSGAEGDQPRAGVAGALQVYQTIQSSAQGYQVPELEAWKGARDAGHLDELVDSLAQHSTSQCPPQPPRFRAPVSLSPN